MATQYTPEDIAEIFEAYNNAIKTSTPISADLAKQMQDAVKATRGVAQAQEDFGKSLGKSALQLGSSLYKGEKGVGQFGNAVESAAGALGMLMLALGPFSLAAKAVAVGLTLLGKGVNAAAKQGDALYKTYQDLGRAGATASDGISGVFRNMQNLGYGIEELDKMVQLVTQNSETLAKFSMTAADGTNAFAEGMAQIQRDGDLRLLGKTTDDISSAGASFIKQQVSMGRRQSDIQGDLGAQTKAYVIELDRLQRLTGTSADALQKQQEDLLAEDAYNVYMEMLESQGAAGKDQIEKIKAVTAQLPKEYQTLVAQSIGGNVEAQQKLMFIAPNLIKDLQDPIKSTSDTTKTLNQDLKNFKGVFAKNYLLDPTMREFGGRMVDLNQAIAQTSDVDKRTDAVTKNAKVTDSATESLTEAQIANMNSRDALQSFVQVGVAPATAALAKLAKITEAATGVVNMKAGQGGGEGAVATRPGAGASISGGAGGEGDAGAIMDAAAEGAAQRSASTKGYLEKMVQVESGGRNIANQSGAGGAPTSSAFGLAQITKGTFEGLVTKAGRENPLYGKTFDDMKGDIKLQMEAARQLTDQNRQFLESRKLPTSDAALYLAHFLGPGGAAKALSQSDNAPLADAVSPAQIEANPNLQKMTTVADLKNWADQKMGGGGFREGGIAEGPTSGYSATLHGTEAVVPLPNGKTIPVEMAGFSSNFADQTAIMTQQVDKLDELIRIMQSQVSVSTKILQAAA